MALLSSLLNGDLFSAIRDKVNAIVSTVNLLGGGTAGQAIKKNSSNDFDFSWTNLREPPAFTGNANKELKVNAAETAIEYFSRNTGQASFSGSQALTTSFANLSGVSFVTPNDGVTRTYLIVAEVGVSIINGASDNEAFAQIYNSTDATLLGNIANPAQPNIASGQSAKLQGSMFYIGTIGPNKTIVVQVKRGTNNTVTAITGSMKLVEISRS